ncbi:MAG TPA: PH domain-containing protein [Anaerolineae bacterium]|nr:PH domain-containing protein [Anaerolineae bacterium]
MKYVEKLMADNEREVFSTRQHYIVLLQRLITSLFAFLVFLGVGLAVLLPKADEGGNQVRFVVGVIALGSLVMPLYLIASAWLQGLRGHEFVRRIWQAALAGIAILAVALIMILQPDLRVIGWIAVVVALVPAAEVVRIFLDWLNERYIITNRRVMEIKGIINKQVSDSALEKVNDVKLRQSVVGRVLGYGTVQIITGSDIGVNRFHRIFNPVRFKREMLNAKEALHTPSIPSRPEETSPESPPIAAVGSGEPKSEAEATSDIPDLLVELAELHQKGIITEEEFQSKKQQLLDRL